MKHVVLPNLPEDRVKLAVVDGRINREIEAGLLMQGVELIKTAVYPGIYPAISWHPDIFLHHAGEDRIIYAPGVNAGLLDDLGKRGFNLIKGATVLSAAYPGNIAYNAARVGNFVIHNLKYTDPVLKAELENSGVEFIHVNQGYSKCSISIVDSNSIMTADRGIARAVEPKGIDVLLIEPDERIVLAGLDRGFIGGGTGLLSGKKWALTGDINNLKSCQRIQNFLNSKGVEPINLSCGEVVDIGSILPVMSE